jgi:hypothetical protein
MTTAAFACNNTLSSLTPRQLIPSVEGICELGRDAVPRVRIGISVADAQQRVPTSEFFQRFRMQMEVLPLVVKSLLVTNTNAICSVTTGFV